MPELFFNVSQWLSVLDEYHLVNFFLIAIHILSLTVQINGHAVARLSGMPILERLDITLFNTLF
jgi:hypothetical protein